MEKIFYWILGRDKNKKLYISTVHSYVDYKMGSK